MWQIRFMSTSCEIALRWMPQKTSADKSPLVQVMAWCWQATSHYLNQWWPSFVLPLGLKQYAQPTIWYDTRYDAHDTIRSAIHLPFLFGKQRLVIPACDQKHCIPPTITSCAVMMRSGYNNGGLLGVSRCSVFVMNSLILLEYTDCFLWYLVFVSNFRMCYICTVSYRIFLRAYRDTYCSLCIVDILMCRCIVSVLVAMWHHWATMS